MTVADLRVWYDYQRFMSHAQSARDLMGVLQNVCRLVPEPDTADVVILHHEPGHYRQIVQEVPALRRKYVIGYGVWETDILPKDMKEGCRYVDEIWTPSTFSLETFARHHPCVTWMPHVVQPRRELPADARDALGKIFDVDAFGINFLHITQEGVARKNTPLVGRAFDWLHRRAPDTRLIVKTIRYPVADNAPLETRTVDNTVFIRGKMPEPLMAALLEYCDIYVSPHASEGWGLPLADAMMARKAVVATGYSGNMDYMTPHNAYLVDYTLGRVRAEQTHYLFTQDMSWAFPHRESLETQMWRATEDLRTGDMRKIEQAFCDIQNFGPQSIARHLTSRLAEISLHLANRR